MFKQKLIRLGPCSSSSCARLQGAGGSALLPACQRPALHRQQQQWHSRHAPAAATPGDGESSDYSQEEADAYAEILRQRKAAKQEALQNLKRKRKFNPLHSKLRVSPADAPAGAAAPAGTTDSAAAAADGEASAAAGKPSPAAAAAAAPRSSSSAAAGARFAARPRAVPAGLQQQQQPVHKPAPSRPAAPAPAAQQQQQQEAFPPLQEVFDGADDASTDDGGSAGGQYPPDSELAAMLAELMAGGDDDVPEVQPLPAKAARRQSPAQLKAAAIAKRAVTHQFRRKQQQAMLQAAAAGDVEDQIEADEVEGEGEEQVVASRQSAAGGKAAAAAAGAKVPARQATAAASAAKGAANDEGADEDDLDWEALGQYEQLEKYLGQLQKENSGAAPRRAKLDPAAGATKPPAAVKPAQPAAAAAAAAAAAMPAAPQVPKPVAAAGFSAGTKRVKSSSGGGSSSRMDKDLNELEQLVAMLQAMESGSSGSGRRQQLQRPAGAAGSTSAAAGGGDPGDALLKALLGSDWEAQLLDDLAAVIDEEDEQTPQQQQQNVRQRQQLAQRPGQPASASSSSSSSAAAGLGQSAQGEAAPDAEEENEEPWADEVTGLLLGLVSISHEKYMSSPVPLPGGVEAVGEEERCAAFWQAPWALFVVDDSAQSCIEYVNEAAGGMFGGSYLDLFGRATHELVGADLTAQSDWAYAVQKVEESASFSVTLPQLELQNLAGQKVVARDVMIWRVDSLEDTPVGMAVLVDSWQRA